MTKKLVLTKPICDATTDFKPYEEEGFAQFAVGEMLALFVGLGVLVMTLTIMSTVAGSTYSTAEPTINAISNGTVEDAVKESIVNVFTAQKTGSTYLPIVVLSLVGFLAVTIVLAGAGGYAGGGGGSRGGSAL